MKTMAEEKIWKPLELVKVTTDYLGQKQIANPRLDAEILLCEIMGLKRRVDLYAGFEREISGKELASYRELIRRRAAREPVSRILGRRDFMGLTFRVTPDVLSPRPETEFLVEAALEAIRPRKPDQEPVDEEVQNEPTVPTAESDSHSDLMPEELERLLDSYAEDVDDADSLDLETPPPKPIPSSRPSAAGSISGSAAKKNVLPITSELAPKVLDLGTGSGCIAVSIAAHLPAARVTAVDASPRALAVAKKNAADNGVADKIDFRQGDWFAGCRRGEAYDVVLSNPPYLVEGDPEIWPEVSGYDPAAALYGGRDGLDCYRRIVPDAPEWVVPGGLILLEVGAGQSGRVADLLRSRGFEQIQIVKDYGGVERVVRGRAPGAF